MSKAEFERQNRLQDLRIGLSSVDETKAPQSYRILQVEYRRLMCRTTLQDSCISAAEIGLKCPDASAPDDHHISHISAVEYGRDCVPGRCSGPGLVLHMACECGKTWKAMFDDHSGGIWISIHDDPDSVPEGWRREKRCPASPT